MLRNSGLVADLVMASNSNLFASTVILSHLALLSVEIKETNNYSTVYSLLNVFKCLKNLNYD